ncbi:MAG: hypothetical protein O6649_08785, partial [Gammaproteobacteria bacterium]|nr:hypothetical protein [Gammaproteobacteria bacterium]
TLVIQQFLMEHLPEPVNQQVSVINFSSEEIVVAASSPQVANYLRLYVTEVQQQIQETFQLSQTLKICTVPESMLKIECPPGSDKPSKVSTETVAAISRSAGWIEDENLKKSLKSLAETLRNNNE